ncbi:MAG: hypothetical protein PF961_16445 [Planctomycetota bacterium]|jgi:hypothetical protein|nr:hypothetical protein [Planctomycetota bacterium]
MRTWILSCLLVFMAGLGAAEAPVHLTGCTLSGVIDGSNLTMSAEMDVVVRKPGEVVVLGPGSVLLADPVLPAGSELRYDPERGYLLTCTRGAEFQLRLDFALQSQELTAQDDKAAWRSASLAVPPAPVRSLTMRSARSDLAVEFPGALQLQRAVDDAGALEVTALLGPGLPFSLRWQPQVTELDAELMFTARSSVVARAELGALHVDSVISYDIAQGKLQECQVRIPAGFSVTGVAGEHIRDWRIDAEVLVVTLNRAVRDHYALRLEGERAVPALPAVVSVDELVPVGATRHSGQIMIGTDSALRVVVAEHAGASQIDAAAFRAVGFADSQRTVPALKRFAYQFAASPVRMVMELAEMVPVLDVTQHLRLNVREDDLLAELHLDCDIRDAPIDRLRVRLPPQFSLTEVIADIAEPGGAIVTADEAGAIVDIPFRAAVQGRHVVVLRCERGVSPLLEPMTVRAPQVIGSRVERGHVLIEAAPSLVLADPSSENLRRVHTAGVTGSGEAQFAYRFRSNAWQLTLNAARRPAGIRAELFHHHALGDGVAHTLVVVNYVITGAPVDSLRFRLPAGLQGVDFVGADVLRADHVDGVWQVALRRRVGGDYNLAIAFSQVLDADKPLIIGGVDSLDAESESGFVVVSASQDLQLEAGDAAPLLAITPAELPEHYRLLTAAPLLASWRYAGRVAAHPVQVTRLPGAEPLAALLELADIETRLSVTADDRVESRTELSYLIKNVSAQFLRLRLPASSSPPRAWVTGADGERAPATVSQDGDYLKVQLPRLANPNQPVILGLSYGATHGAVGDRISLKTPELGMRASFVRWHVQGDSDWHLATDALGDARIEAATPPSMAQRLSLIAEMWLRGAIKAPWVVIGIALAIAFAVVAVVRPRRLPMLGVAALGCVVLVLGVSAVLSGSMPSMPSAAVSELTVTDLLQLDGGTAPSLDLRVVPAWRSGWSVLPVFVALLLAVVALVPWGPKRSGQVRCAAGFAAGVVGLLAIPAAFPVLAHVLTWGLALVLLLTALRQLGLRWQPVAARSAVTALMLCGMLGLGGCGGERAASLAEETGSLVRIHAVQLDSDLKVDMGLSLHFARDQERDLLPVTAVVLNGDDLPEGLSLVLHDGHSVVRADRAGTYAVHLQFLMPMAFEHEESGAMRLAMPAALRNEVHLELPRPGLAIASTTAVHLARGEDAERSWCDAVFAPGAPIVLQWQPRDRVLAQEDTVAFGEISSVFRVDGGVVAGVHRLGYRIAQGQLEVLRVAVPTGTSVTDVRGEGLGAWRFDAATGVLDVRLSQAAVGSYTLSVVTQMPLGALPAAADLKPVRLLDVAGQRGEMAVAASRAVRLELVSNPSPIRIEDSARRVASLLSQLAVEAPALRQACRFGDEAEVAPLALRVHAVEPELLATEVATVKLGDERAVYDGQLAVVVRKAAVFAIDLALSPGYDVDALSGEGVSHWDELGADATGRRLVRVHLRAATEGSVNLTIALSRPLGDDTELPAPGVRVVGARKHSGHLVVLPSRGMRLRVGERSEVSEVHPLELNVRTEGALAFRLLGADWRLQLLPERLPPALRLEALHVARVGPGLVRHEHRLRFRIEHAPLRKISIDLPPGVIGVDVDGPDIARSERQGDRLTVELSRKWFDRTYPLTLRCDTRLAPDADVVLTALGTPQATIRSNRIAVIGTDRVELAAQDAGDLQRSDARSIDTGFGAGDLSGAAFCFAGNGASYQLSLAARRLAPAALQQAEVQRAQLVTVVTALGDTITQLRLSLEVGNRRHLRLQLPEGAELWELTVNGRAVEAARADDAWLVPVAHTGVADMAMELVATYVRAGGAPLLGASEIVGPQLDLPMQNLEWVLFVPEDLRFDDFGGTLHVVEDDLVTPSFASYTRSEYEASVGSDNRQSEQRARAFAQAGAELAENGEQYAARAALQQAFNYSFVDQALNEDARVQLNTLAKEQALAALVSRRTKLRRGAGSDLGDDFDRASVQRLAAGLSKDDSANLERITARLAEQQEEADAVVPRIAVHLPQQGRVLRFQAPLQVDPTVPMRVSFAVHAPRRAWDGGLALAVLMLVLAVAFAVPVALARLVPRPQEPKPLATADAASLLDAAEAAMDQHATEVDQDEV